MNERKVYARRGPEYKWTLISFQEIAINEDFIICEADGTPIDHFIATSTPYMTRRAFLGDTMVVEVTNVV